MIYRDWGFEDHPFETKALPATELGERLLVGREKEVASAMRRISSGTKMTTIEGLNGAGKTSVVNVSAYKLLSAHKGDPEGALFIPCRKIFQLKNEGDVDDFINDVYYNVAQTLIEQVEDVRRHGFNLETGAVNRWLNSPQIKTFQGGLAMFQAGMNAETNTGKGFEGVGIRNVVDEWLRTIFPTNKDGAVICTIDNLELLQSSEVAKRKLEELRDLLFNAHGLRWALCGSLGIVYGVVSSPRLEGFVHAPIEIEEIGQEHAERILDSRIAAYAKTRNAYLPITTGGFRRIYDVLKGNIRSVLGQVDNYCQWVADRELPKTDVEKDSLLEAWLGETSSANYESARSALRPRALKTFNLACDRTVFSPSDFEEFGFNSVQAFRPSVKELEDVGILVSTQDEGDKRRKTIQVTSKGWLVNLHLTAQAQAAGRAAANSVPAPSSTRE